MISSPSNFSCRIHRFHIQCTVVRFVSFFSGGFSTAIVVNPPERKLRKNCSSDQEKLLKFEAEGREFAKFLRSLEQSIQTVKGQNNF